MVDAADFRRIALSFDGTGEYPHFDRRAFKARVTFATLAADGLTANIKFAPDEQALKCAVAPDAFAALKTHGAGRGGRARFWPRSAKRSSGLPWRWRGGALRRNRPAAAPPPFGGPERKADNLREFLPVQRVMDLFLSWPPAAPTHCWRQSQPL